MAEIGNWFNSLPPLTRSWFGGTVGVSLLGRFGLLSPQYLVLVYQLVVHNFQIWRPVTALFFYPITPQTGFHFLINLYFLVNYSKLLETGVFATRPADYAFMLLFNWGASILICLFMNIMFLMDAMVLSVLYVWCMLNRETIVQFWFGTQFKAMYLPWVLFGFNLIISGGGINEIIGILVGHLYYFMKFQYPEEYGGPALIETPNFMMNLFPPRIQRGGFGQPPPAPNQPQGGPPPGGNPRFGGGHQWGRGNQLGG